MGYCPQFDPILEWLTAREVSAYFSSHFPHSMHMLISTLPSLQHLHIFARLRGLPEDQCAAAVDDMIRLVGLTAGADKAAGSYSGGFVFLCVVVDALG